MKISHAVKSSKGQFKIQQMVFVLVAILIFFGIVAVFYVSVKFGSVKQDVQEGRQEASMMQARKMVGTPEFIWTSWEDCASCVDLDKVFLLKNRTSYQGFWKDIALLKVVRVQPKYLTRECNSVNYPRCNEITLIEKGGFQSYDSFVSLCRYDNEIGETRCELGKIIVGFEGVKNAR